jgi:hypothetical protein
MGFVTIVIQFIEFALEHLPEAVQEETIPLILQTMTNYFQNSGDITFI